MVFEYTLGGIVTIAMLIYLIIALVRPERF
ncbi:MAG TPA: K(+)-transporting ATPase subunit F [Methylocella sp.]|nr:K(+)-transporting ATPase subunit F [Methylocella sp.]